MCHCIEHKFEKYPYINTITIFPERYTILTLGNKVILIVLDTYYIYIY